MKSVYQNEYYSSDEYRERLRRLAVAIKERDERRASVKRDRQSEGERLEKTHPILRPWRKGDPIVQIKPIEEGEEYRPIPKLDSPNMSDVRKPQGQDSKGATSFVGVVFTGRKTPRRAGSDEAFGTSGNVFAKNPFATNKRPRALRFE